MTALVEITLRSSALVAAGLVAVALLRRRSAAVRHGLLAGALAASVAVMPLSWVLPAMTIALPSPVSAPPSVPVHSAVSVGAAASTVMPVSGATSPTFPLTLLLAVWITGAVASWAALLAAFGRLRRLASHAVHVADGPWPRIARDAAMTLGVRRPVALLESGAVDMPATWGVFRPRVLVPACGRRWSEARMHAVLLHELAHIQRHDWLVQVAAEALRAAWWWNPLVWLAVRRLRRESEHACDDVVLAAGMPAPDYAMHLVAVAQVCRPSSRPVAAAMPMARRSTLEGRIAAMLNHRLGHQALSRRALAATAAGLLALAVPTAALRVAQDGPLPLSGVVYDPSGGVVPDAALTLEDDRQNKWQTTSDSTGRFEFAPVAAGSYVLEVSLPGFRSLRQELALGAASDWNRAVTLQVGTVQESITVRVQRPKPRAASPTSGPTPVRVGGNIRPPTKTLDVRPIYPPSMRDAGREGRVPLEAIIGRDGTVVSVRVATAQVHPDFAQAAIDAVRQWRFTPTLLNGTAVEVVMTVTVEFELED